MYPRSVIVLAGILSVGAALYLVATDRAGTWNLYLSITGLFGVPLAGVFVRRIFTQRANTTGVVSGPIGGAIPAFAVQGTESTPFAVSTAAFLRAVITRHLASVGWGMLRAKDPHDIAPLTIYGIRSDYTRRFTPRQQATAGPEAGSRNGPSAGRTP